MSLHNHEIFTNLLGFKVLVGRGLKLKGKMLKVLKRCLRDEGFECGINGLKSILKIKVKSVNSKSFALPYS